MPRNCCVTGCRGNYRGTTNHPKENVSVFRFPDDPELRAKWICFIARENLVVTDNTVVCEKHFAPHFIIRVDTATRPDGSVLSVPRKNPKLTPDAYPSYFPNTTTYLTTEPPLKRKAPDICRAEIDAHDEMNFEDRLHNDHINDFAELCNKIEKFISKYQDWTIVHGKDCICLCIIDVVNVPRIELSLKISEELNIALYKGFLKAETQALEMVTGSGSKLKSWSQLTTLLSHFRDGEKSGNSIFLNNDCKRAADKRHAVKNLRKQSTLIIK